MAGPLDDLRVIDVSSGQAPGIATMVLGDFGADVIKVESPGGDPYRHLAAAPMWLRGKRSVVLDLTQPEARERLHDLVRGADVVMASYPPGEAAALGADYETLSALNPGLVYCSVTGWGPVGQYAHYPAVESVVAAKIGRMKSFQGLADREGPSFAAVQVATHAASQAAIHGILAALFVRDRLGRGQLVETSLLQGMLPYDLMGLMGAQAGGSQSQAPAAPSAPAAPANAAVAAGLRMPTLNYHPVMTKDGQWIQCGNLLEHLFHAFIDAIGLADIYQHERFHGDPGTWDPEAREEVRDMMLTRVRERTADEWMERFTASGNVAAEPFRTTQQALDMPDLVLNGNVVEVEDPRLGTTRQLGLIADLTETPGEIRGPAPAVGQHTDEVLAEPARTPWRASGNGDSPAPSHPLEGITVLDCSTMIATPQGVSMIGDLGARVIKIEQIGGDPFRGMGGGIAVRPNGSKESICIDLKSPEGQEVIRGLIAKADMIVHNYRPGVPERLGIGYEQARAINPDVIWASVNGYGPSGPGADRPSTHPIAGAAVGGALLQVGAGMPPTDCDSVEEMRAGARRLMQANELNPDPSTSMAAASALLLALYARKRFGGGQRVFANMLGANAYANADDFISYEGKPPREEPDADVYGLNALYRLYPAGEGWVFLGVRSDEEWAALCDATGRPDLAGDPRFGTAETRRAHDAELADELCRLFADRDPDECERTLIAAGVACVRADAVGFGEFLMEDQHVRDNGFTVEVDQPRLGRVQRWGPVVSLDRTPGRYGPAPLAGQHTDAILAELGYDRARIAELRERGVVWSEEP